MRYEKMMKRVLSIVMLAAVTLCSACGAPQEQPTPQPDTETVPQEGQEPETETVPQEEQEPETETEAEEMTPGVYTFYNETQKRWLGYRDRSLVLSETPVYWNLQRADGRGFYFYAEDSALLLDIDNANVREGTTVKLWNLTGYDVQIWQFTGNAISYCGDSNYCLGFQGGEAVLQRRSNDPLQQWTAARQEAVYYRSWVSNGGIIELQLPPDICTVISQERLQQWANDLERAYYTYYELTNFKPYAHIVVEGYKPCKFLGYVVGDSNVIHIDRDFLYGDLRKMAGRHNDWNFCALHEMGHMFDNRRPWPFEPELMTDLKVAYVMEQNGAGAAPSEFDGSECFYGKDIMEAYRRLGSDFSQTYNVFGCAYRFMEIKEQIGWAPFKQTFHHLQQSGGNYSGPEKLEKFAELLSYYSGKDVKGYFSAAEWATMRNAANN